MYHFLTKHTLLYIKYALQLNTEIIFFWQNMRHFMKNILGIKDVRVPPARSLLTRNNLAHSSQNTLHLIS